MEYKFEMGQGKLRVVVPKELDHHLATQLKEEADLLIETYHVKTLIFDFTCRHKIFCQFDLVTAVLMCVFRAPMHIADHIIGILLCLCDLGYIFRRVQSL